MKNLLKQIFKITVRTVRDVNTLKLERAEYYIFLGVVVKRICKPI